MFNWSLYRTFLVDRWGGGYLYIISKERIYNLGNKVFFDFGMVFQWKRGHLNQIYIRRKKNIVNLTF